MPAVLFAVLAAFGVLSALAALQTLREMGEYRERFERDAPDMRGFADYPAYEGRLAKRQIRRGRAVTNREIAVAMLQQYDTVGAPPDVTRWASLVCVGGLAVICVLLVLSGMRPFAAVAFVALLVLLALTGWKWYIRYAIKRSLAATRRVHAGT